LTFPLVADEAMAVSDPESSEAIALALAELSAERQVIVFTNQHEDVALLKRLKPGVQVLNLGVPIPAEFDEPLTGLIRGARPPMATTFDPRVPVGAHSIGAIFPVPEDHPQFLSRLDQIPLAEPDESFTAALERLRVDLNKDHPRLGWSQVSGEDWARTGASATLSEKLESVGGCPHRFYDELHRLPGRTFQKKQMEKAEAWLRDNGFLEAPPPEAEIRSRVELALTAAEDAQKEHATHLLLRAYVPETTAGSLFEC
jgi:uncharacterized protein YhaN